MASGVFDNAMIALGTATVDWTAGQTDIWCALGKSDFGANVSKTAWDTYSDTTAYGVSDQSPNIGYTLGGEYLTLITVALNGSVAQFDASDRAWTAATFSAYYAYNSHGTQAGAANPLLSYHDLGGEQAVAAGTLTLQWAGVGVFSITISDAA
jgi:hypothetical protein